MHENAKQIPSSNDFLSYSPSNSGNATNTITLKSNNPITILIPILLLCITTTSAHAELRNNMSADVVVGQRDFNSNSSGTTTNKLNSPRNIFCDGTRLYISEYTNHRVLIFNQIPTSNNASADIIIGETASSGTTANKLNYPMAVVSDGKRLFIADANNNRVLIYDIGASSIELGPQFEQGKAVLGKVFNDLNQNG